MATELVKHVNDSLFESVVLKSAIPVLVDFWAPWCSPCKALAPTIEKIAEENNGKLLVCKVNIDESPDIAAQFGIRGIPTVILFKNGKVVHQVTGNVPKMEIDAMLG